jgi:hypothetical protein
MKQQKMMSEQDVVDALKFDKELPQLKSQFELLIEVINSLEFKRNSLRTALSVLQNQISAARDSLKIWQSWYFATKYICCWRTSITYIAANKPDITTFASKWYRRIKIEMSFIFIVSVLFY